ncbi:M24 family metallopeptidase [Sulfobacillus harzensis]|uniref:Aminopeptidase P family protein n=1 Tax=Sulfobacillus harzensis TaxID=2729629 RepID=A0A7Y0L1M8_9FIRM|nr:Xaa-Pro peptidase family protein [Sulfobacillus harzensis]NMP21418.1 aminopeptidase P family protein [Sulfobacillus harzensis]
MRGSLERFQKALAERQLSGAIIAAPEELSSTNLRYLSGFTGSSAYLLITPERAWLLTDFRYLDQAAGESPDFTVVRHESPVAKTLAALCQDNGIHTLGWEPDKVPYEMWEGWNGTVPVVWKPLERLIETLRIVKDSQEIHSMREAARIAGESLMVVLPGMVGRQEIEVALDLEMEMRRRGAESLGFPTIIGAGERGALPHAHPTRRMIRKGELVTIDFGAQVDGYKSDETVTVGTGEVPAKLREIWDIVAEAQRRGIAAVKPGNTSRDVDSAVRNYIQAKGFGEYFGHGTGHGVGLDIHEDPFASQSPAQERVLEEGMTITVEPGIYIPGLGGARLEDTLVVTRDGAERLTIVPKHYQVLS